MAEKKKMIKIEPNPNKRSSVKVNMQVVNMAGGSPKYTYDDNGNKKVSTKWQKPKHMTRLPGTTVHYTAALGESGLKTGLDEIVDNPYANLSYYKPGWENILKGVNKIRLQELLEYKHNKERGYYTNQVSDIRSSYDTTNVPFYQKSESKVLLNDGVTYLNLDNPIHEANYYMLKAHKMIANSYKELEENPYATHYIVDDEEKSTREASQVRKMHKFGARLEEILELPGDTIIDFTKALGIGTDGGMSKTEAYTLLDEYVRKNNSNYKDFMSMYDLWKDVANREIFEGYVELFDLMNCPGLISSRNNKLFWSKPADPEKGGKSEPYEWKDKSAFVRNFLTAPEYQEEVDILRALYREKKRYA